MTAQITASDEDTFRVIEPVVLYDGPARFVGYRGAEYRTEKIREVVAEVGPDVSRSTFSCAFCEYSAGTVNSVRGHLASHVRRGEVPKREQRARRGDEALEALEALVAQRVEERTAKLRAERDEARREARALRKRLEGIRSAIGLEA